MCRSAAGARAGVPAIVLALAAGSLIGLAARPAGAQGVPSAPVSAWLTTTDRANLLTRQPDLWLAPDEGTAPLTIDVDAATAYQAMEGFGAAFTDSAAWLVHQKLPASARQELMVRLFDRASGIGLSYLRQPIGATDFALSLYSYDDVGPGETDPGLTRFSIDHDRAYILPLLREALSINPALRVMATPWSPPGWMKTSGSMIGGSLAPEMRAVYADYLVRFVQAYRDAGVPVDRLTPQNEPHFTPPDYPGMHMGSAEQAAFVRDHLGPGLAAAGLATHIDVWDHNWTDTTYADAVLADPLAARYVAGTAWHCYGGEPSAMSELHDLHPDKDIVLSECSGGTWQGGFAAGFAQDMQLVVAAPRNWAGLIVKWNVALDADGGPHAGGCVGCTGLVTIDPAEGRVTSFNHEYYALGHVSKFVVPDARRVASNTFGPSSIQDVAFRNPDGSLVLIVFNDDPEARRSFKVRERGRSFSYTLPPLGAVTFTWRADAEPTDLAAGRPTSASSVESGRFAAANAVDGDPGTRWSSAFVEPQWIDVDLGDRYSLSRVVLEWEAAYAVVYSVQVSDDRSAWTTVYSTSAGRGGVEVVQPAPTPGRYVRLLCTGRAFVYGSQWGFSLWDLRINGTRAGPAPVPAVNLALNRPTAASSSEGVEFPAANAVDGDGESRWSSAFSDLQWLQVDLGARYTLSSVVIEWEAAYAVAYTIQVSDDGSRWTTVYGTTAGAGGTEAIALPTGATGRYLRLACSERALVYGARWGYSLWELRAFGVAAGAATGANLALNRPALASSTEGPALQAANAVDGSGGSRWSSSFSEPQWLQVDLGDRYRLSSVEIEWESAYAVAYELQVSDAAAAWTTVYAQADGHGGTERIALPPAATGRYLRLRCARRTSVYGAQWGFSLWELRAFGAPVAAVSQE